MHPAPIPVQRRACSVASALMVFATCLTLLSPLGVPLARAVANGEAASLVLGQPDFATTDARNAPSAVGSMMNPSAVAVDPTTGKVFVADSDNNRVVRFASMASLSNGANADGVLGQADFTSRSSNRNDVPTASTLSSPNGVAVDSTGTLWVADRDNNRVLRFTSAASKLDGADADGVLGQANFAGYSSNRGSTTATTNTLALPLGVTVDSTGTLWVADTDNSRVLRFASAASLPNGADADGVLGQADFTSNASNRGGTTATANTLAYLTGVTVDNSTGTLWVADRDNNRVLRFANAVSAPDGADADSVLGQADFAGNWSNRNRTVADGPSAVAVDPTTGKVFVADTNNSRVLRFASAASLSNGADADGVLGQADFVGYSSNRGTTATANSLNYPTGVAVDSTGTLWVADNSNHRVLRFASAASKLDGADADGVLGQANFAGDASNRGGTTATANTLFDPFGVAVDRTGTLWVADSSNNRVLRFASAASLPNGADADGVLGQTNFAGDASNRGGTTATANTLAGPVGVAVDSTGTLWVADSSNNRVLRFASAASTPDGADADGVLGQASGGTTATANTLADPIGVAVDRTGTLWVADSSNHRVLRFASAASKLAGADADGVLGQADFTSNAANRSGTAATANTLAYPQGVAVDPTTGRVFVADSNNSRVLGYSSSTDATLSNLVLSSGTLTPTFAADTTSYTATVPFTVTGLTVTPTVSDTNATVTVNGTPVPSDSASGNITLTVGVNVILVVVTAQDPRITQTYTITVTRTAASSNLSGLTLSGGTLSPSFATDTTSYTVAVSNTVTSVTVTPTVSDTTATVTVNGIPVTSGSASDNITLTVGVNVITTIVTTADGSSSKTYRVSVTRAGVAEIELTQSYHLAKGTNTTAQPSGLAALANTLILTITVRNNGPDAVTGVVITDSFPTAAVSTTWTWTCVGTSGGVCGNANGTGNLNETLGLLPKDGSVTFVVMGSLLNPNTWSNTPSVTAPTGVVDTNTSNNSITVGNFMTFVPLVVK